MREVKPAPRRRKPKTVEVRALLAGDDYAELARPGPWREALDDWLEHVDGQKRQPFTAVGAKRLLARIADWTPERLRAAVDHSAANGWQGLFEPDERPGRANGRRPVYDSDGTLPHEPSEPPIDLSAITI